jgi:hypothetical protein
MINELIFRNVLKTIKEYPNYTLDIIDSFSDNQFRAKTKLLNQIDNFLQDEFKVVILGCWYGSILVPAMAPRVKQIIAVDLDDNVVRIGKNRFFKEYENVSWSTGDVFLKTLDYSQTNLVINTSCEHMLPMKLWPYWSNVSKNCYFAFTSNNMDSIKGHTNCVYSLEEFKLQLPNNSEVLHQEEVKDERGIRYVLIGKTNFSQLTD